ncbi:unnamed protein product [Clonostachys solani]|uniref:Uncharacterized protein n=1 Tax=Clonostachys solani TaxID=160281 RepID=A0A9P0E8Y5_9HYPO|nr:unnamed protein product [Clonostachys solani]
MVAYTICRTPPQTRYLPHRYARKAIAKKNGTTLLSEPEKLDPGQERLYSFYEPSLRAGHHIITTTQDIQLGTGNQKKHLEDKQEFTVITPRYKLPVSAVHTVYPPQGHTDNVEILPHIVLNDPQLPWARVAVEKVERESRGRVPWLAMLVFRQEELHWNNPAHPEEKLSGTKTLTLTLGELGKRVASGTENFTTKIVKGDGSLMLDDEPDTALDIIYVPKQHFNSFFKDANASPGSQKKCDVSRYQWLSHTRNINTTGMANSGIDGELGVFSVVISQRVGPLDITEPTDLIVHLVSIENLWSMNYPVQKDRVALCSLESWSYTCLPANSFNIWDAFRHVGKEHDVYRIDPKIVEKTLAPEKKMDERLKTRLLDGYVMTRYRTQTGEETAAWMRGPFVPKIIDHGDTDKEISNSGQDLQIMDKVTGIMDITYSTAWQLGKALALADQGFTTALSRLSVTISRGSMDETKKSLLKSQGAFQDKSEVLGQLVESLKTLRSLHNPSGLRKGPDARWLPSSTLSMDMSRQAVHVQQQYLHHLKETTRKITRNISGDRVYDEFNNPLSPDWMIICSWVLDRMYLAGVPAHYYIPDPTYLQQETLRFFHIDRHWIDAMIDGALSIASHLPDDEDKRIELKNIINELLEQHPEGLHYPPQRPSFGFFLRSQLCIKFPDLIVEAYGSDPDVPDPTIIIRQENISEGLLLVLFDKKPGSSEFTKLILREPPHQQAFACGSHLTKDEISVPVTRIYTVPLEEQKKDKDRNFPFIHDPYPKSDPNNPMFIWDDEGVPISTLKLPAYADEVQRILVANMKENYTEDVPTATMMGIQLNHPMYFLQIDMDKTLFAGSSTENDGMLVGLKMLKPRRKNEALEAAVRSEDYVIHRPSGIDWDVPFHVQPVQGETPLPVISLPAPHIRHIPILPFPPTPASDQTLRRKSPTLFSYSIYPLRERDLINQVNKKDVKQDLIFSIHPNRDNDYWDLKRVTISIPWGKTKDSRPTLMDHYDGTGATMVSDFRFNVTTTIGTEAGDKMFFYLTILPRAASIQKMEVKNLSVILNGMLIGDYHEWHSGRWGAPKVTISVNEEYQQNNTKMEVEVVLNL